MMTPYASLILSSRKITRFCLCIAKNVVITENMIDVLRPAPKDTLYPEYESMVVGKRAKEFIKKGAPFTWENV